MSERPSLSAALVANLSSLSANLAVVLQPERSKTSVEELYLNFIEVNLSKMKSRKL